MTSAAKLVTAACSTAAITGIGELCAQIAAMGGDYAELSAVLAGCADANQALWDELLQIPGLVLPGRAGHAADAATRAADIASGGDSSCPCS